MSFLQAALDNRWQRVAVVMALMNIAVYAFTAKYEWLGWLGLHWTHVLNAGRVGDILLVWFCISAALLFAYSFFVQFHARAVTWVGVAGLCWCALWGLELIWLHRFLVFD